MNKISNILFVTGAITISNQVILAQETNSPGPAAGAREEAGRLPVLTKISEADDIWTARGVGNGFRPKLQEVGVSVGTSVATYDIGGKKPHDLLLGRLYYGHLLGSEVGVDKWYAGNWEFIPEVFGGWQYYQASRYLIGTTFMFRYNLMTGTRWVPFMDAGLGGTLTDIGNPDLGTPGEFNGQIGPGVSYFWRENVALTIQYRYMHTSNAGIGTPNQGVNENILYMGMSWYF